MNFRKLLALSSLGVLSCGLIFGDGLSIHNVSAAEKNIPERLDKIKTNKTVNDGDHKYGKPLKVYISETTGVQIEVHAKNAKESEAIRKEKGWSKNEPVEIIKDKKASMETSDYIDPQKEQDILVQPMHTDTSEWDVVGTEYWTMDFSYSSWFVDTIWHSHGGDYKFVLPAHKSDGRELEAVGDVQLWENDPDNPDDFVAEWEFGPSSYDISYIARGISGYVDGDKAEFYTKHKPYYATSTKKLENVMYYD